jgi:hypothetical protein
MIYSLAIISCNFLHLFLFVLNLIAFLVSIWSNHFRLDQNRITLGMGYQIKNLSFQLGYMKQLILANTSDTFKANNNLQVFIFHNFDCSKKEKSPK